MMEGISHESCALAGTWGLGKLIAFWDDNNISIDGHVDGWFTDDTAKRFEAYGWHVVANVQGHDPEAVDAAINAGKKVTDKPTLICCKTIIGMGSPNKADTHDVHGAALGDAEVAATREHHRLEISALRDSQACIRGMGCAHQRRRSGKIVEQQVCRIPRPRSPRKLPNSSAASRASCPPTGKRIRPRCWPKPTKRPKPSRRARLRRTRSMRWLRYCPNSSAVRPT